MEAHTFNPELGIWQRANAVSLSYSDGNATEAALLDVLRQATDLSCSSLELQQAIHDWPSEYHLSPLRHNLLRHFNFKASDRILELGCGAGAITRYLGESGATVVAVEGSAQRAAMAAARCRDLPNVRVYQDNLVDFPARESFDYVLLIGVLEYASCFIQGDKPEAQCLFAACRHLPQDGALILAIENQLGLKYFNGVAEDHTGIPYFGINDRYSPQTPRTFGRIALSKLLQEAGLPQQRLYLPFPDYKQPTIMLTPRATETPNFRCEDLLYGLSSLNRHASPFHAFQEGRAWSTICANGLLPDMANSFLFYAQRQTTHAPHESALLGATYAASRHPDFATATHFLAEGPAQGIRVRKSALFPHRRGAHPPRLRGVKHALDDSPYLEGRVLAHDIQDLLTCNAPLATLCKRLEDWLNLLPTPGPERRFDSPVPGAFLDCTPRNIITSKDGRLHYFDLEWQAEAEIPLGWIFTRGLVDCLQTEYLPDAFRGKSIRAMLLLTAHELGLEVAPEMLEETFAREMAFQRSVGIPSSITHLSPREFLAQVPGDQNQILCYSAHWEAEVGRVKSTISWQITKPFRLLANLPDLLGKMFRRKTS